MASTIIKESEEGNIMNEVTIKDGDLLNAFLKVTNKQPHKKLFSKMPMLLMAVSMMIIDVEGELGLKGKEEPKEDKYDESTEAGRMERVADILRNEQE